jgi:hypothetical protein
MMVQSGMEKGMVDGYEQLDELLGIATADSADSTDSTDSADSTHSARG